MSTAAYEPSLSSLSLSGSTAVAPSTTTQPSDPTNFAFPSYTSFPPFYTLQPNLTTQARQLELWSGLVTSYCAHHRLFRLSLSSPPQDLFSNAAIKRNLKAADIRTVLDHMSKPENGPRIEWIAPTARGQTSNTCYVYWRTPTEWADAIYNFVEETGQNGAVLTIYELREGESSLGREWRDIDEALLRKVLNVLVKRGKAQIFGQEESAASEGKQPAKRKGRQSTAAETERPEPKRPRGRTSRSRSAKRDLKGESPDLSSDEDPTRVRATLYDAVAGRVGYEGFLLDKPGKPLPPDQVMFSRADAPIRYEEHDKYFAHRHLPEDQRLPDSDLLKAIHSYASDFYGSGKLGNGPEEYQSLDETALIAFGILIEEAAAESLGKTGDLAFVDGPHRDGMP